MAVRYEIVGRILIVRLGRAGFPFLMEAVKAGLADPHFLSPGALLFDVRDNPGQRPRYPEVSADVEFLSSQREFIGGRWAYLTTEEPARFGLGRMFQSAAETKGVTVALFTEEKEAIAWLGNAD